MKRKILALILAMLLVLPMGSGTARAAESLYVPAGPEDGDVTPEAMAACRGALKEFGYSGSDEAFFLLFNLKDEASYVLGANGGGYVILSLENLEVSEAGEGDSPYAGYPDCRKYYGGVLNYYVKLEKGTNRYWNTVRETEERLGPGLQNLQTVCLHIALAALQCIDAGGQVSGYPLPWA